MSLQIAFANQPLERVTLPHGEQPFHAGSVGLWDYHVARQCAKQHKAIALSRGTQMVDVPQEVDGVAYHIIPDAGDERKTLWHRRKRRLLRLGVKPKPTRPHFLLPQFFSGYTQQVAQQVRANRCDVVHINNFSQIAPEIRRLNPHVCINLHMHCEWLNQLDQNVLSKRLEVCDFISGVSQYIVDRIAQTFPKQAAKCFSLWNGVDASLFAPNQQIQRDQETLEIVFIGRVSPEKGVHVLLQAFNRVIEQFPQARLTIIGRQLPAAHAFIVALDSDPLVQNLERFYARRHNLYQEYLNQLPSPAAKRHLHYVPDMPQAHLVPAYQRADVFVYPSVWNEPFGMPLVEAMACGVPVVSTRSGGIPEFVKDGENGLLVERGNADALAQALMEILADPERRQRMGQTGRELVDASLTWRHVARNFLTSIEAVEA